MLIAGVFCIVQIRNTAHLWNVTSKTKIELASRPWSRLFAARVCARSFKIVWKLNVSTLLLSNENYHRHFLSDIQNYRCHMIKRINRFYSEMFILCAFTLGSYHSDYSRSKLTHNFYGIYNYMTIMSYSIGVGELRKKILFRSTYRIYRRTNLRL